MDQKSVCVDLNKPLPQDVLPGPNLTTKDEQSEQIESLLKQILPTSEAKNAKDELAWHFGLDKQSVRIKKQKRTRRTPQNVALVNAKKAAAVPKFGHRQLEKPASGWSYAELLPIRDMWREYIRRAIGKSVAQVTEGGNNLSLILSKCELLGADVRVEKSKDPGMVGMRGIVVRETRMMIEIVNSRSQHKKICKSICVLVFEVGNLEITVFGNHLLTRPAERSVKKIKSMLYADI